VLYQLNLNAFKLESLQSFNRLGAVGSHTGGAVNAKKADTWEHLKI
jgi:hypothetical protein